MDRQKIQDQATALRAKVRAMDDGALVGPGLIRFDVEVGKDELELVFRIPDLQDVAELDMELPVLPVEGASEESLVAMVEDGKQVEAMELLLAKPEGIKNFMQRASRLLTICSYKPKLVDEPEAQEGSYPVRALPSQTRVYLFMSLMGAAGFTAAAAKEVAPFAGAGPSSEPATQSPGGTADTPTTSSTQDTGGPSSSG
ncbi:MAG: hypothetical protein V3S82_10410 [Dehalococcoidia bacterium]